MPDLEERGQALEWVLDKLAAAKKVVPLSLPSFKAPEFKFAPPPKGFQAPKISPERRKAEIELWNKWNGSGRKPKDLDPLISSFSNMIQKGVNDYRRAEVPTSAIEHQHKKYLVQAFKTWDQKKGGALHTWVTWNLRHVNRYVESNKNFASIPENISQHIGSYNAVKAELTEKFGHEPDVHSIHDHILETGHPNLGRLSLKDIKRLEKEQRRGLIQSGHDVEEIGGAPYGSSRAEEVKQLIVHELTPQERVVHEYSFGLNGKPKLRPGEMATKLKMDNSKISKLRKSIRLKMMKYIGPENA